MFITCLYHLFMPMHKSGPVSNRTYLLIHQSHYNYSASHFLPHNLLKSKMAHYQLNNKYLFYNPSLLNERCRHMTLPQTWYWQWDIEETHHVTKLALGHCFMSFISLEFGFFVSVSDTHSEIYLYQSSGMQSLINHFFKITQVLLRI